MYFTCTSGERKITCSLEYEETHYNSIARLELLWDGLNCSPVGSDLWGVTNVLEKHKPNCGSMVGII